MRKFVGLLAFALFCALPSQAKAATCVVSHTFVTGETLTAAILNANPTSIVNCANNLDFNNIGTAGIYASQIIPGNGAQATFGGTQTYTFPVSGNGIGIAFNTTSPMQFPNTAGGSSSTFLRGDSGLAVEGVTNTVFGVQSSPTGGPVLALDASGNLGVLGTFRATGIVLAGPLSGVTTGGFSGTITSTNQQPLSYANAAGGAAQTTIVADGSFRVPAGTGFFNTVFGMLNQGGTKVAAIDSAGNLGIAGGIIVPGVATFGNAVNVTGALTLSTTPLAVSSGGTGTATPGLTAGTGLGVSGSFPTQQFALSVPVAVANGGTGATTQIFPKVFLNGAQLTTAPRIEIFNGSINNQTLTLNFSSSYAVAPVCVAGWSTAGHSISISSVGTGSVNITDGAADTYYVHCIGQ